METFADFIMQIDDKAQRERTGEVLNWMNNHFPQLAKRMAWNQPVFTDHDTFIIGFSLAKKHLAVAPEKVAIDRFSNDIHQAGFHHTKMLIQFPWDKSVDYSLLTKLIMFNIQDKAYCETFWRK